ncbi:hypothetical protein ABPG74_006018 [Tetrahymena malaccensis]
MSSTSTSNTGSSSSDSSSSTGTLGNGTIAIIVMIGISFVICVLSRGTTSPLLISFLGALLPVITFIVLYAYPKETTVTDKSQDPRICCDTYQVWRIIYLVVMILTAVICFLWRIGLDVLNSHYARKAPSAFQQKKQEEYQQQKQLLKLVKEQGDDDQQQLLGNNVQQENDFSKNAGPDFVDMSQTKSRFGATGNQKKML